MTVTSVSGASSPKPTEAELKAGVQKAIASGNQQAIQDAMKALNEFYASAAKKDSAGDGTKVEKREQQPGDAEKAAAAGEANKRAVDEITAMKAAAAKEAAELHRRNDPGEMIYNEEGRKAIRDESQKLDTKEEVKEAGFKHKTGKLAKAFKRVGNRTGNVDTIEKIFTNKAEYDEAVKAAKADGTWDKDHPKYTLLEGKSLEGAKNMSEKAKKDVEENLAMYKKFEAIYNNPATDDKTKQNAFIEMIDAAKLINESYDASKMFDEEGNIDKDAYQRTMIRYAGGDFKGNIDERKVLADDADISKRKTKGMYKAAGLDVEKDYTWAMRGGVLATGLGTGALIGVLGGGVVAESVATAVATATATATATVTGTNTNTTVTNDNFTTETFGPNGEHDLDRVTQSTTTVVSDVVENTTTVVGTATEQASEVARASISKGKQALNGMKGAIPAALLSAILTKDNGGPDVFNGASVEEVLKNAKQVRGKHNQELVQHIIDIPNDKLTPRQKAAIIYASMSNATGKKVNTEELASAYLIANYVAEHPEEPAPVEPTVSTPAVSTPAVSEPRPIERTEDKPGKKIDKDFNVKHRLGMGPYQYADALGVPPKYRAEFIKMFKQDNNMDGTGKLYNKTPLLQVEYTFKDGTTFKPGTREEAQKKIDEYNLGKVKKPKDNKGKDISGKQRAVKGREIRYIQKPGEKGYWIYSDTREKVPEKELKEHPTYIEYVKKHGHG